jgi:hypothetical protein
LAALAITAAALFGLAAVAPGAGRLTEIMVLVPANLLATVARFVLLRLAIGRHAHRAGLGALPRSSPQH